MNIDFFKPVTYFAVTSFSSHHYCIPVNYSPVDETVAQIKYEDLLFYSKPVEFDRSISLENRIKSFYSLSKNWDGYGATVPEKNVINNSVYFIKSLPDSLLTDVEMESIVPTPYGSIVIDFENNQDIISVEIGENKIGFFTDFKSSENLSSNGILFNQETLPRELTEAFQKLYQEKNI